MRTQGEDGVYMPRSKASGGTSPTSTSGAFSLQDITEAPSVVFVTTTRPPTPHASVNVPLPLLLSSPPGPGSGFCRHTSSSLTLHPNDAPWEWPFLLTPVQLQPLSLCPRATQHVHRSSWEPWPLLNHQYMGNPAQYVAHGPPTWERKCSIWENKRSGWSRGQEDVPEAT